MLQYAIFYLNMYQVPVNLKLQNQYFNIFFRHKGWNCILKLILNIANSVHNS